MRIDVPVRPRGLALSVCCATSPGAEFLRDAISRCFFRDADDRLTGLGHMNYLEDRRLTEIAEQWISNSISS